MDIDEEFDSLCLPSEKRSLASRAREKIMWGEPAKQVRGWLVILGIDRLTAKRIVAIAVRQRAKAFRVLVAKDLVPGILLVVGGAAAGIAAMVMNGQFAQENWFRLLDVATVWGLVELVSFLAAVGGVIPTWRGLWRLIGGARAKDALREEEVGDGDVTGD